MKQTVYFSDGTSVLLSSRSQRIPDGYFLAQIGEYQTAPSGNPAVIMIHDQADTIYTKEWQLALYCHNFGMLKNNVCNMMDSAAALMNKTGVNLYANHILGENLKERDPWLDKFRLFARGTYAVRDYDSDHYQVWAMDGENPPQMKPRKAAPISVADIESGLVKSEDYLYNPKETLFAFMVPNNFNNKGGGVTTISPFPGGLIYDWTPSPLEPYQFFPVSTRRSPILSPKTLWTKVDTYQNPYRRF